MLSGGEAFDVPPSLYSSEYDNVARAMNPNAGGSADQDGDQEQNDPAADEGMDDDAKVS